MIGLIRPNQSLQAPEIIEAAFSIVRVELFVLGVPNFTLSTENFS
jgi:hypothetical protein